MQYVALLYDKESPITLPGTPEFAADLAGYRDFGRRFAAAILGGAPLEGSTTARTVRSGGGPGDEVLVTDGPFAETAEVLGGWYVLEAATLDEVIDQARELPVASRPAGAVEVRPIVQVWEPEKPVERTPGDTRYLAMIYGRETPADIPGTPEWEAGAAEHGRFTERHAGALLGGMALHPVGTATTVRVRDGELLVTDGPFAESAEVLGGFYELRAASWDEAVAVARDVPTNPGGAVELRPIHDLLPPGS
ncbi:MAG TPA: YciI family protein [Acidimicrobiales bacterium]